MTAFDNENELGCLVSDISCASQTAKTVQQESVRRNFFFIVQSRFKVEWSVATKVYQGEAARPQKLKPNTITTVNW